MGFNKKYMPDYDVLVKEILTVDSETFMNRYLKADVLIGPTDSLELLNEYAKEYYEGDQESTQKFIEILKEGTSKN